MADQQGESEVAMRSDTAQCKFDKFPSPYSYVQEH